ncbi:MAG: sugar transferase [Bacteroidaceae bacterium]|nr:sugar transferase [Bacteroidaceae bacterium]
MHFTENGLRLRYIIGDFMASSAAWLLFNCYRYEKNAYRNYADLGDYLLHFREIELQILIPFFWLLMFYYSGYYNKPIHKDRLHEIRITFSSVVLGTLLVFFLAIINDMPSLYRIFYEFLSFYFLLQFLFVYVFRFCLTQRLMRSVHRRTFGFKTLIIGVGQNARKLNDELTDRSKGIGNLVTGFVDVGLETCRVPKKRVVGTWEDIDTLIRNLQIQEIIVAVDTVDEYIIFNFLNTLYQYNIPIQITTGKYNILSRSVKMTSLYTEPMIEVTRDNMPESQKNIKQTFDVLASFFSLIFLTPLFLYIAYRIRRESSGPVFYRQERIGYHGAPFVIYKFRTMYDDAEQADQPLLSSEDDERVTNFGKVMRKYRLDELPQFINILKGEMSLVGPRPERKYYIDQIIKKAPHYCMVYNVKPGLTSWATVKNGYANTVDKMIERLKYDIVYMRSRSLATDIKILFYTIRTIFTGQGI